MSQDVVSLRPGFIIILYENLDEKCDKLPASWRGLPGSLCRSVTSCQPHGEVYPAACVAGLQQTYNKRWYNKDVRKTQVGDIYLYLLVVVHTTVG